MFRKRYLAGMIVAALVLALAVSGVALATTNSQGGPAKANLFQDFVAKFAANLGVDQDKVTAALEATKKQMLDEAVQKGYITQEQADKMAGRMNGGFGWFGAFHGKKHPAEGGQKGFKNLDGVAGILGITPEQLKAELDSGKKLPQIVTEHGLTMEQFNQKMLELRKEAIAKMVSDSKLTQEQADKMIQKMEQRFNKPAPGTAN